MGFRIVGDLITHAGRQNKFPAILQLRMQLSLKAKQNMALFAPMVRQVARRVFDQAHPDRAKILGSPIGGTGLAAMFHWRDGGPIRGAKWDVGHIHELFLSCHMPVQGLKQTVDVLNIVVQMGADADRWAAWCQEHIVCGQ